MAANVCNSVESLKKVPFSRLSTSDKVKLNLIMQQATSRIKKVNVFFSDLSGIASFFSRSLKRCSVLDKIVSRRLPRASSTRWNFNSRIVNTVYENRDDLLECFEAIKTGSHGPFDQLSVREASGYVRMLQDEDFFFFRCFFTTSCPTSTFCTRSSRRRTLMKSSPKGPRELHKQCADH